jgi:DNA-binding CsgD family transcriptional regulator
MATNIFPIKKTALSKRDALLLLEIIHASLFCSTEKEFKRIIEDVRTMVRTDSEANLLGKMPDEKIEGISLPFDGSVGEHSPRAKVIFKHIAPHLHRKFTQLSSAGTKKKGCASLTSREKEILLWVKEGKSAWEISSILGISRNTVKFHLKNIFRKLNTTSRSQAVVVAFGRGLIDL